MQSYLVELLAFSQENQQWIEDRIQRAIHPNGWKKTANWLRYWSLTGVCITIFGTLIAIIITVGIFATNRVSQESEFRGTTQTRLANIETRLGGIEGSLLSLRATQAANLPTDKKNIAEAKAILDTAKQSAIKLPASVVEHSGKNFINAASKEPAAWDVALRFAEYRSYLNTFNPDVIPSGKRNTKTEYWIMSPSGYARPSLDVTGIVPADQAARFNRIGEGLKTDTGYGNAFIISTRGGVILDGYELKNVVFQYTHIVYRGGPLQAKNVYFIGCTFDFISDKNSKEMVAAILSSPAISLGLS